MAWFLTQSEGTASKCIYQLHMKCIKWNLTLVFDTTLCPDKKWTPRTLSIIALYGCGSLKKLNAQYCSAIFKEMRKLLH